MNEVLGNVSSTQNVKGSVSSAKNLTGGVSISGVAGIVGPAPDIQIGTTTTLETGESAYVELDESSTQLTPIFNFGIPRGESGEAGKDGLNGKDGYTPIKGVDYFTEEDVASLNLENYALKSEIPNLEDYALKSDIPDVSAYQTEEEVNALINQAIGGIENGSY